MIAIQGMDHIVLPVADVDRSLAFYHGILGLAIEREAEFRAGRVGFPSVRVDERCVIDLFPRPASERASAGQNLDHFCLVTDVEDLAPLVAELERQQVPIDSQPTDRWGAQGMAMSVYIRDPDGNRVEIRTYAPAARAEAERRRAAHHVRA
jgi:catechol 2,3-dioxygenase-like lactoylglutathione lyase family enzyme